MSENSQNANSEVKSSGRRDFLIKAGRAATVAPVAASVLLSTSMEAEAGFMKSTGDKYKRRKKKMRRKKRKFLKKLFH